MTFFSALCDQFDGCGLEAFVNHCRMSGLLMKKPIKRSPIATRLKRQDTGAGVAPARESTGVQSDIDDAQCPRCVVVAVVVVVTGREAGSDIGQ